MSFYTQQTRGGSPLHYKTGQTSWTEEKDTGFAEVAVEFVGHGNLGMGEGREGLVVCWTHVRLYIVKQDGE